MKTLVFQNSAGLFVEVLTDLIDGNEEFTTYQVQYRDANGKMQLGLSDEIIAAGFDFKVDEYNLGYVKEMAALNDLTVTALETGHEEEVIYQGTYYGGPIGVELLE